MKNRLRVIWYVLTDKHFRYYGARREERIFEDMERDLDQYKNGAVYLHIPTKKKINMEYEKQMKQKPLKFIVSNPYYESLFRREIDAIRDMIGEFEVVKTKPCLGGVDMKIWILPIYNHIADASKKDSQH